MGIDQRRNPAAASASLSLGRTNPWNELYTDLKRRHGKANPAKAAVARNVLIAAWHVLSLEQPFKRSARDRTPLIGPSPMRVAG